MCWSDIYTEGTCFYHLIVPAKQKKEFVVGKHPQQEILATIGEKCRFQSGE